MYRRRALALFVGVTAGCGTRSTGPTSTPSPERVTTTGSEPDTATPSPTDTTTPTARDALEDAVTALNDLYAELEPALASLAVEGLDYELLTDRLQAARTALASAEASATGSGANTTDAATEARLRSLSDTRWIFDRLVRTFVRFREAYDVHERLHAAYRANDDTTETGSLSDRFVTLAREAASASSAAASRYDAMNEFDPALDVRYDAFEGPVFRVSDTAEALAPFGQGLETAIRAREGYRAAVTSYEEGSYRQARDAFADLLSDFTDARDDFEDAEGLSGPLESYLADYRCETRAARLACAEYRAACREQLDEDATAAERRRERAEERYTECGVRTA